MIKPPKYFSEIADLISKLYPDAKKIVEVGVGRSPYTAIRLKTLLPRAEIIVTDVDREALRYAARLNLNAIYDDVSRPKLEIYEGSDVIYSIRPPPELIHKLEELGIRVGADILVAPLPEDVYLSSMKKNWMRIRGPPTSIYILRQ
ncbi:MAG: UPF0146 family protein [Nitrososphaeria archaeon]|nr:UPF0146 family protein [Aigarchaeota archaeon]MCX8188059.1 UPF0146 family protein [Nitrososphaeria archaeon]MDW8021149.1 UPF0146 family protein [Nitrososphaerota archaeon]